MSVRTADRAAADRAGRDPAGGKPIGTTGADAPGGPTSWPFVGREDELAGVLNHVAGDAPESVVVAGRPGAGRTRLAQEAVRVAGRRGHPTAWATATRTMSGVPLGALAHLVPPGTATASPAAALKDAVAALARPEGPWLVLAIDDAHLLDALSAALVHKLVLTRTAAVVLTVRAGVQEPDLVTTVWKDGLARRFELAPLSRQEHRRMLDAALGGIVDSRTSEHLWRLSAGSALFLRELVEAGHETGALRLVRGVWRWDGPLTPTRRLSEVVQAQAGELGPAERCALEVLAVGEPLALTDLIELSDEDAVAALERRGIVTAEPVGRRVEVRLAQPLHAEMLRAELPHTEARRLRSLLAARTGVGRATDPVRLGELLVGSDAPAEPAALVDAATRANSRGAHGLAERLATAAAEDGAGCPAHVALVEALRWQGRTLEAESAAAGATCRTASDDERAQLAVARALNLFYGLGRGEEAMAVLAEAGTGAGPRAEANVTAVHSVLSFAAGRLQEAAELGRRVLGLEVADDGADAWSCAALSATRAVLGSTREAIALAERGWAAAQRSLTVPEMSSAQLVLAHDELLALELAGHAAQAQERAAALHRDRMTASESAADGQAALQLGSAALAAGRAATAVRWLAEAAARLADSDPIGCLPLCHAHLTQAHALLGDRIAVQEVSAASDAARACAVRVFDPQTALAHAWRAAAEQRTWEAGDQALRAASIAAGMAQPAVEAHALHTAVRFGRAAEAAGRLDELAQHVGGLAPTFAEHAEAFLRGLGDRLDVVTDRFATAGAALLAADAAAHAAEAHERGGRRRDATASAARAAALARSCGDVATPALRRSTPPALTPRQREVAMLAAAGLHSRQIARRLVISVRTVETHLTNAFGKLGIHRRADLGQALRAGPDAPQATAGDGLPSAP